MIVVVDICISWKLLRLYRYVKQFIYSLSFPNYERTWLILSVEDFSRYFMNVLNVSDCCVGSSVDDLLITVVSNETSQPSLPTGRNV